MLANLKIRTLVIAALAVLLALMLASGLMGIYGAGHSVALVQQVSLRDQQKSTEFNAMRLYI